MPVSLDLPRIPDQPGVYLFKDEAGTVLYVGKATSLAARLHSYAQPQADPRREVMLEKASTVDFVLTKTAKEALLLEASLVRRHRPRYNVRLTDDKRYPYLRLSGDRWPRISLTRDTRDAESTYFGPFPDAGAARRTLEVVREAFKVRNCKELLPGGCLAFQLRLCLAPCIEDAATRVRAVGDGPLARADVPREYGRAAEEARRFLRGDAAGVTTILEEDMEAAAEREDFERAARLRDRIAAVRATLERQAVFGRSREDRDVFVVAREGPLALGVLTLVRRGEVAGQERFAFRRVPAEATEEDLVGEFVRRYYETMPSIPHEVVVEALPTEAAAIEELLSERRGSEVRFHIPKRGDLVQVVDIARRNASFHLAQERLRRGDADAQRELEDLAARLGLATPPRRIECVDVSHLGGSEVVASLVVLEEGRPRRSQYRRFRVRTERNDDVAAVREVVARRLAHDDWPQPDLLLIDGGPTQLAAALESLAAAARLDLPLASLAKREEEVFVPGPGGLPRRAPVPRDAPALLPLQRARDEAHRFALAYQRTRRKAVLTASGLDAVPGIGPARKRALLLAFGSPEAVARATEEEIARVPGIGPAVARRIVAALRPGP